MTDEKAEILVRLGIDPSLDKDEIIRQLRMKHAALVQAEIEERKRAAGMPVIVETIVDCPTR